jgi:hypothetical protein
VSWKHIVVCDVCGNIAQGTWNPSNAMWEAPKNWFVMQRNSSMGQTPSDLCQGCAPKKVAFKGSAEIWDGDTTK